MVYFCLCLLLSLIVGVFVNAVSGILPIIFFVIGRTLVYFGNSKDKAAATVYSISFLCSLFYAIICYIYMKSHDYDCLLIGDTQYYLNQLRDMLLSGGSLYDIVSSLWDDYDIFVRGNKGYLAFLGIWGYLAKTIGADAYFTIQVATIAICSLGAVIVRKLLCYHLSDQRIISKMTWIISLCSMFFQYTTFIVRDGIIALCFYYMLLLLHQKQSFLVLVKMLLMSIIIATIRTETGLASLLFLPTMFLLQSKNSRRGVITTLGIIASLAILVYFLNSNITSITTLYNDNIDNYFTDTGSGVISFLDGIPIVGPFINVIYGVIQPIPCWARLSVYYMPLLPLKHLYNIMGFPSVIYVAFNTYVVIYLLLFLFRKNKGIKIELGALKWILIPSTVFLLLQSGIVEPRRIMGVFPVFYVIWAMAYEKMPRKYNQTSFNLFLGIFMIFQLIGFIRYI